jgi:ribosomal protein S18 acetylase RimI-like enzyme
MFTIERLDPRQAHAALPELIALLRDSVDNGASVSFLPPLDEQAARKYWAEVVRLVGAAQLDLCTRQNGLHRAEVVKLLVHTAWRRHGIGARRMRALERQAQQAKRTTLVLDTRAGDPAEALYVKLGYRRAGLIPEYARSADGALDASVFYYRLLEKE